MIGRFFRAKGEYLSIASIAMSTDRLPSSITRGSPFKDTSFCSAIRCFRAHFRAPSKHPCDKSRAESSAE